MKDIQIIKSKKANLDDQAPAKPEKGKKKKVEKNKEGENAEAPTSFNHQFFTIHAFDSIRVVPPTKRE